ncbi:MAG: sugar phosphate isomerase/epimerase [Spirochaetaceae bacterium]|nr:sugar phosphate isomerase/epimerase [Spirochaetaceae bacterium]
MPATIDAVMVKLGSVIMGSREGDAAVGTTHGSSVSDVFALAREHRKRGLAAAYCPTASIDDRDRLRDIRDAFAAAGVVIAEVGGWRNMLHPDPAEGKRERQRMADYLAIADEVDARCAITCIGSPGGPGQGSHDAFNFTPDAFDAAVENARWLIDTVKPKRTRFVYEIYPFSVADTPANIRRLLDAVDRPEFAAHMDLVNLINCPRLYYRSGDVAREVVRLFGDRIVSAHAKDLKMAEDVSVIMHEVRPGCGNIDYAAYLRVLHELPHTVPLMLEHLHTQEEYDLGVDHIRAVAAAEQIPLA